MRLIVNGETVDDSGDPALPAFLIRRGADPARVAVMVNDVIVFQRDRAGATLREGDRVEIFIFAGGG
ncbi:MAG: sulfur carrier protein ThiS [Kiritimatiellia bacterium]